MKLEEKVVKLLTAKNKTLAIAESCTGGMIGELLTSVPGASKIFGFGVVSYSAKAKQKILHVKPALIQKYGEVSEPVACAMAQGIQKLSKSDLAIAVTGIAGPTGGTAKKSVGTVCLSLISKDGRHIKNRTFVFKGRRHNIRKSASTAALQWVHEYLTKQLKEVV